METRSTTSEWRFKALVKCFLKRNISELGSTKFLVLLLVKYCLDISFGRGIFRWTDLDVKGGLDHFFCFVVLDHN